ncbi:hypothetical protein LWM68_40530 [Niabella sp. W65]|nr:hypothetical protein [Niabella sp. W65]MCH7368470.1 hypothetical protein [Niabella sp. W65]
MKKNVAILLLAVSGFFAACGDKDNSVEPPKPTEVVVVGADVASPTPSVISANTTWTADKKYLIKGFVYVEPGVTLTIEPGTVIHGDKQSQGTLIITKGAKINAAGTAQRPIVFTSNMAVGNRKAGDWGGIIILGNAPVNQGTAKIEGGLTFPAGKDSYVVYGGNDAADNSGTLTYVRVEFAGVAFSLNNEINSLTFGGVGSGTRVSYVQVYAAGDDAYEWFGGTVNADHLVSVKTLDDDLDTDFGFSGKVQFALVQRNPSAFDISGSNGFESDNDGDGSTKTPLTGAIFSNVTVVGPLNGTGNTVDPLFQHGAQIRRNSSQSVINSVFVGYPIGVYIDDTKGTPTSGNYTSGKLLFQKQCYRRQPDPVQSY